MIILQQSFKQMRKIIISITILVCACCNISNAQEKTYREPTGTNNWFIEAFGSGLFYSFNYEKVLYRQPGYGWIARIGASYNPSDYLMLNAIYLDRNTFLFPFTSSMVFGQRKEKLEVGAGFTLLTQGINNREVVPTAVLGFRVLELNGVYFRVNYTPVILRRDFIHWFGFSLGKNFSTK
jgi:hypothetical protein